MVATATSQSCYRISEYLVIRDQPRLFEFVIDRLEVLAKVLPECVSLTGFDRVIAHTPHRSDIVVWALCERRTRSEQGCCEQKHRERFFHLASSDCRDGR